MTPLECVKTTSTGETRYLTRARPYSIRWHHQTTAKYNYGYQLLSRTEVDPTAADPRFNQFYVFDALGSTSELTDETGAIRVTYQYDAWGNGRKGAGAAENPKQFTGYELDPETGLYYAKARYYDSTTGTFVTQDSYLGQMDLPPSLHRYSYGYANPLKYVDPTGHGIGDWAGNGAQDINGNLINRIRPQPAVPNTALSRLRCGAAGRKRDWRRRGRPTVTL
jgi:RHS repeat-associated protein